jgi:hypothetical protein
MEGGPRPARRLVSRRAPDRGLSRRVDLGGGQCRWPGSSRTPPDDEHDAEDDGGAGQAPDQLVALRAQPQQAATPSARATRPPRANVIANASYWPRGVSVPDVNASSIGSDEIDVPNAMRTPATPIASAEAIVPTSWLRTVSGAAGAAARGRLRRCRGRGGCREPAGRRPRRGRRRA